MIKKEFYREQRALAVKEKYPIFSISTKHLLSKLLPVSLLMLSAPAFSADCSPDATGYVRIHADSCTVITSDANGYQNATGRYPNPRVWLSGQTIDTTIDGNFSVTFDTAITFDGLRVYGVSVSDVQAGEASRPKLITKDVYFKASVSGDTAGIIGSAAYSGGYIKGENHTYDLSLSTTVLNGGNTPLYGIVAGSSVPSGETDAAYNGIYSTVELENLTLNQNIPTTGVIPPLNTGLRAIQGAYQNSNNGSSGRIVINNKLDMNLAGKRVEGIYISGSAVDGSGKEATSIVELNHSDIVLSGTTLAYDSSAIKIGKSRSVGSGKGTLISKGIMRIDASSPAKSAIKMAVSGSILDASAATAQTVVRANNTVLRVGFEDWGSSVSSDAISASFNNATFRTDSDTASLILVDKNQRQVELDFTGNTVYSATDFNVSGDTENNLLAATNGWLVDVKTGSSVNMNIADGKMKGMTSIEGSGQLNVSLNSGASWELSEKGSDTTTTLTSLSLSDSTLVAHKTASTAPAAYTLVGDVSNQRSTITLSNGTAGDTFTINGNYSGSAALADAGRIALDTELGDDGSLSDRLIINGLADGYTKISINNVGGLGDKALEGIEVVTTQGTTADAFSQEGRVVAGSYDYSLVNKGTNWYLTSQFIDPTVPTDPDPDPGTDPDPEPGESIRVLRPEIGSYLANAAAGNTLFTTRLHDRLGETQYTDALTGEKLVTSMWMRNEGGRNSFRDGSGQLKTTGNRYVVQIGGDLAQWSTDGLNRWHLGAMAGYANAESKTHSRLKGHESKSKIDGYSAGLYGTWYANAQDKSGAYVDSWVLYNWFDNEVKGDDLKADNYKSRGVTASLETGYSFRLGGSENASYWLSPRAQAVWMGVGSDSHRDAYGTRVQDGESNNLLTRLGLKAYASGRADTDSDKQRTFQPFVEVNWLHYMKDVSVKLANDRHYQDGAKNIGEVKLGVEGQLTSKLNVWGNVAQQVGDSGYHDSQAMLGVKYSF